MSKNISAPSKSFLILFLLALFGTFFCLSLWLNFENPSVIDYSGEVYQNSFYNRVPSRHIAAKPAPAPTVDISNWKTYTNKKYGFSFLYDPSWKILTGKKQGDYFLLQIDPGKKYYDFKIYISTKDYYALAGIPTQTDTIGGQTAINAGDLLYGVQKGQYYYTFDIGQDTSLQTVFDALVHSVTFQ